MAMEPVAALPRVLFLQGPGPFPVSSTARTIGEQKAKVKSFYRISSTPGGCLNYLRPKLFVGDGRLTRQMEGYGP